MTNDTGVMFFVCESGDYDDMHRLIIRSESGEARGGREFERAFFVRIEERKEREGHRGPRMIRDAR